MSELRKGRPAVEYGVSGAYPAERDRPRRKFEAAAAVGKPPEHVYKLFDPNVAVTRAEARPSVEKRAVWIVHGMGQQIKFSTLDSLTEGVMSVARYPRGKHQFEPKAVSIEVDGQILQRVELTVGGADGNRDVELHLYEAYWAPLTEGVAKLTDVVGFLVNGSVRGLLNSWKPFKRAMFGQIEDFRIRLRVPLYIVAVLILLGSLVAINAVIIGATAAKVNVFGITQVPDSLWRILTSVASALSAFGITLGTVLFVAELWKPLPPTGPGRDEDRDKKPRKYGNSRVLAWVSWVGTSIAAAGIALAAILFLGSICFFKFKTLLAFMDSLVKHLDAASRQLQFASSSIILASVLIILLAMAARGLNRSEWSIAAGSGALLFLLIVAAALELATGVAVGIASAGLHFNWPFAAEWSIHLKNFLCGSWWVWPFLAFLSSQVRTTMVEYVGDVVIYVTSNKIDRFDSVREKIKDTAYKSAQAVFKATQKGNAFEYEHVAIIGHSLGSVIAYDTLNRLINEDRLSDGKLRICERTRLFETFGSPLNKIAFFFTIQGTDTFQMREQLAESVQPLIMNYSYRPFAWINVRSPNDIISGETYFYDLPDTAHPVRSKISDKLMTGEPGALPLKYNRAQDIVDPNAAVALAAHVDYWKNRLIWEELYQAVAK